VSESVRLSTENLGNYFSEIDVTWQDNVPGETLEVVASWRHLTFDLESYFRTYLSHNFGMA